MKFINIISLFCALLALLNTVDVHALSHAIEGDDHNKIENCQSCEEFVVSTYQDASIAPQVYSFTFHEYNFIEKPLLFSNRSIFINQEKYLGKFHNKPPPFTI